MEDTEYEEMLQYLKDKTLPWNLKGNKNKTKRDSWVKKIKKFYTVNVYYKMTLQIT